MKSNPLFNGNMMKAKCTRTCDRFRFPHKPTLCSVLLQGFVRMKRFRKAIKRWQIAIDKRTLNLGVYKAFLTWELQ